MTNPRVLLYDIETIQNVVASFNLYERGGMHLPHENVIQERYIVCAAWKWLDEHKVHAVSVLDAPRRYKANPHDDLFVCETLHSQLSQADAIVAHNGDEYDIKFTEGRIIKHGLSPLPPIHKIDTLKVARSRFLLNSNRLDYLARYLGVGKKIHIDNQLWLGILAAKEPAATRAIRKMVAYNRHDVRLLEGVYLKLLPYVPNPVNQQLYTPGDPCSRCGSPRMTSQGIRRTTTRLYKRFQCQNCGGWDRASLADKSPKAARIPI